MTVSVLTKRDGIFHIYMLDKLCQHDQNLNFFVQKKSTKHNDSKVIYFDFKL